MLPLDRESVLFFPVLTQSKKMGMSISRNSKKSSWQHPQPESCELKLLSIYGHSPLALAYFKYSEACLMGQTRSYSCGNKSTDCRSLLLETAQSRAWVMYSLIHEAGWPWPCLSPCLGQLESQREEGKTGVVHGGCTWYKGGEITWDWRT